MRQGVYRPLPASSSGPLLAVAGRCSTPLSTPSLGPQALDAGSRRRLSTQARDAGSPGFPLFLDFGRGRGYRSRQSSSFPNVHWHKRHSGRSQSQSIGAALQARQPCRPRKSRIRHLFSLATVVPPTHPLLTAHSTLQRNATRARRDFEPRVLGLFARRT
jgi:hypothetical protein